MQMDPGMPQQTSGRFNEKVRGLTPKSRVAKQDLAFGGAKPSAAKPPGGKMMRPPLAQNKNLVDGFDKKEWIRQYKMMKKDINIEERDRYRPLLCLKKDF